MQRISATVYSLSTDIISTNTVVPRLCAPQHQQRLHPTLPSQCDNTVFTGYTVY